MINKAMILAAGRGTRMQPITHYTPKSMIFVGGTSMIHRSIEKLVDFGIKDIIINTYYLAEKLEIHIKESKYYDNSNIEIIREEELLESAGGVKNALYFLGDGPFFVLNSDSIWLEETESILSKMSKYWDPYKMDCLMSLYPVLDQKFFFQNGGDFDLTADNLLSTKKNKQERKYIFSGIYLMNKKFLDNTPNGVLSFTYLFNNRKTCEHILDRVHGITHDGEWFHISNPDALNNAEKFFSLYKINKVL